MKYTCVDCSYVYDESLGEAEIRLPAGSRIEDIADIFACPNCGALSDMFEPIREEILYAEYSGRKIGPELEHIPFVHFSDGKEIEVMVGESLHPHEDEHYITSLALYDEYGDRVEEVFFSSDQEPVSTFDVSDLDTYELRAVCNIHGVWSTGLIENTEA